MEELFNKTKTITKPWGFELIWAHTDKYVGKLLHVLSGEKLSRQYHEVKEETLHLLSGNLKLELGSEDNLFIKHLTPGETFHLPPKTIHRMIAVTDCVLLEVSTPELNDVVRLQDAYGR